MRLVKRAYDVGREAGLRTLLSKSSAYLYWSGKQRCWEFVPVATISIDGLEAKFGTTGRAPRSLQIFERGERTMLGDILEETTVSDTFWDVGANIGYYSCFVGQRTDVVAFEPSPVAAEECRKNLERNGIEAPVYEYALADSSDTSELPPGIVSRTEDEPVEVQMKRGDEVVGDTGPPTIVKMDVEGTELDVIEGMEETLSSDDCRLFYCEVHTGEASDIRSIDDYGETLESFNERVRSFGFEVEVLQNRGAEVHVKGKKSGL